MNSMMRGLMNQEVAIGVGQVFPSDTQVFKFWKRNVLNNRIENVKKKYGLQWAYKIKTPPRQRYYLKAVYNRKPTHERDFSKYCCLVQGANGMVFLVTEKGILPKM